MTSSSMTTMTMMIDECISLARSTVVDVFPSPAKMAKGLDSINDASNYPLQGQGPPPSMPHVYAWPGAAINDGVPSPIHRCVGTRHQALHQILRIMHYQCNRLPDPSIFSPHNGTHDIRAFCRLASCPRPQHSLLRCTTVLGAVYIQFHSTVPPWLCRSQCAFGIVAPLASHSHFDGGDR